MEINDERVTVEMLVEWARNAHQDNVKGLALAILAGYDVRGDDSLAPNTFMFVGHPALREEARAKPDQIEAQATDEAA